MGVPNEGRVWINHPRRSEGREKTNADTMSKIQAVYLYSTPSRGAIAELSENSRLEN
jgi:hypothetical protein